MITLQDVRDAANVIEGHVHRTPLIGSDYLSRRVGVRMLLKLESFQKTGSFKPRGAYNKLHSLTAGERERGVITLSAGNHGQSLAWAAAQWGVPATVVMPSRALRSKIVSTESYGGTVHLTGGDMLEATRAIQEEQGQTLVHPFDDLKIIAGAGTVALEALEDAPEADAIIAGVGGGGLVSGVAAAAKLLNPRIRVIGVEPEGAAAMSISIAQGRPARLDRLDTVADGLAAPFAGEHTLSHVQRFVDEVITVSDEEILHAMTLVMERCKLVVEPAGVAGVAALLSGKAAVKPGSTVVCVISGGNVGAADLKRLL